ncbi:MAG: universal stress protein [Nocardioidaceae bacterium]
MTVLVGYLPTDEGNAALAAAVDETRRRSTKLLVMVDEEPGAADALRERLTGADVDHDVISTRRTVSPAEQLLALAEQHQPDLLVIGLRRRTPVGKLILGSNAQQILLQARCAVLAVKA